jgi:hypothetical protein
MSMPPNVDLDGHPSEPLTLGYTENEPAKLIAPDGIVTDDSLDFNGGSLTVSFGSSGLPEDQLSILTNANILLNGSTVQYDADGAGGNGPVDIGTVSGGADGADLVISFNTGDATPAAVTALIRHITYFNTSESPSTLSRSVTFAVDDRDVGGTGSDTATINVAAVNDPPANTVPEPQTTDENTPVTITGLQVSDPDIGSSNSVTVTLSVDQAPSTSTRPFLAALSPSRSPTTTRRASRSLVIRRPSISRLRPASSIRRPGTTTAATR